MNLTPQKTEKQKTAFAVLRSTTLSEVKFKDPDWGIKSTLA
jgi:hypothetical protein